MAIYRTGQASMDAQGYITGYGTKWREQLTLIRAGATIIFLSNPLQFGVITEVVNDTSMRAITTNGAVVAKTNYIILLHDSLTVDGLAQDVAETLRYYQGKETQFESFIEFLENFDFAKLESLTNQTIQKAAEAKTSATNAKASENKAKEYSDKAASFAFPMTQYDWPVITGAESFYIKIAKLTDPGSNNSHLTLMVTNGGNYGSTYGNIDFIEISARGLPSSLTAENVSRYLNIRRLGSTGLTDDNQMRYGLVKGDGFIEVWAFQRAFINGAKVAVLAQTGRAELYIPNGFVKQTAVPSGYVESYASRIYDTANKPTKADLGLENAMLVGAFGLGGNGPSTNGKMSDVELLKALRDKGGHFWRADRPTGSTATIYSHGSGIFSRCGDTWSAINIDYATGKVKIYSGNDNGLNNGTFKVNELYGAANKPSKSDVGLGNVSNDAQVKKAGDTMTGDLEIQKGTPSIRLKSASGNAHLWFQNSDGVERGVIWAEPNTADKGTVRIRAKTTGGTTGGDVIIHHTGKIESNSSQVNGKAQARTIDVNNPDTNTGSTSVKISGKQHTPMIFERDTNANLSIGFKLAGLSLKRLGVDLDGDLSYGENENQAANSKVVTLAMLSKDQTLGGAYIFSKLATFNAGFAGSWEPENISDKTVDLNGLVIKKDDVGAVRYYHCLSSGGGANITNKPSGVNGNFLLRVESIRKVSQTDYTNKQTLISTDTSREYVRYCNNGTFSAWREVVVSGQNQDVSVKTLSATGRLSGGELAVGGNGSLNGNVSVGGGSLSAIPSQDKGVIMGRGSMVRDTSDGRLVLSSSGGAEKKLSLQPAGANASNNGVEISCTAASAGDTKIAFGQGAAMRSNNTGSLILSSKEGQLLYLRAAGDAKSDGQVTLSSSGTLAASGNITTTGSVTANGGFSAQGKMCNFGALELWHESTPYIDFHHQNSTSDYTARIIQDSANQLTLECANTRVTGALAGMGVIRGANGDAFSAWAYSDPTGGNGAILQAPKIISRFNTKGGGARVAMWLEEYVGNEHQAVFEVSGFGSATQYWHLKSNGKIWNSANGDVAFAGTSDLRYKDNVVDYDGLQSLENIKAMNLIKFTYKNDEKKRERRGVAAQQIMEIDPCYVKESNGSYKDENGETVEVNKLVLDTNPLLMDALCAIKALSAQVDELKEEIRKLKGE